MVAFAGWIALATTYVLAWQATMDLCVNCLDVLVTANMETARLPMGRQYVPVKLGIQESSANKICAIFYAWMEVLNFFFFRKGLLQNLIS